MPSASNTKLSESLCYPSTSTSTTTPPPPPESPLAALLRWARLKKYRIEVTYGVYVYTPGEKLFFWAIFCLLFASISTAVLLCAARNLARGYHYYCYPYPLLSALPGAGAGVAAETSTAELGAAAAANSQGAWGVRVDR